MRESPEGSSDLDIGPTLGWPLQTRPVASVRVASCLVIGGGFLGGSVARALADSGHGVVLFSRSFHKTLVEESASPEAAAIRKVAGTIATTRELANLIESSEVVLYFAGGSTPAGAGADASGAVELSVVPATTVLELMASSSTRRLVLASSGGTVYGEPKPPPNPRGAPDGARSRFTGTTR